MSSERRTIYVGQTNDIKRRTLEHKSQLTDGFTKKYNCKKLVYFEIISDRLQAMMREKEIKGWKRIRKIALIEEVNPKWEDLAVDWYKDREQPVSPP
jgi:putative endonuclease